MGDESNILKLVLLGDCAVGKTALIQHFTSLGFSNTYRATIGVGLGTYQISVYGKNLNLRVWDVSGKHRFPSVIVSHFEAPFVVLLVYDVTNRVSYDHAKSWYTRSREGLDKAVVILVGNKCDGIRQVSTEEGQVLGIQLGVAFIEVTAKEISHVNMLFQFLYINYRQAVKTWKSVPSAYYEKVKGENNKGCESSK